jgi:hypothetical protein
MGEWLDLGITGRYCGQSPPAGEHGLCFAGTYAAGGDAPTGNLLSPISQGGSL